MKNITSKGVFIHANWLCENSFGVERTELELY